MKLRSILFLSLSVALAACTMKPAASDTGYVGTWARGTQYARRFVAIARVGDRVLFRPGTQSEDGKWQWRCGWDGRCAEQVDGETTSEYGFRTWIDPKTSHLMVECTGKVTKPAEMDIHYVDELVVEPGGKRIVAYTIERSGQRFEGAARPKYVFDKVADAVADPPTSTPGPDR
jgi:hypothetical protein